MAPTTSKTTNLTDTLAEFVARETGCVGREPSSTPGKPIEREVDTKTKQRTGGARTAG